MRYNNTRLSLKLALVFILVLTVSMVSTTATAQNLRLLPAAVGDLAATALVTPIATKSAPDVPRERVAVSRALDGEQALDSQTTPFTARSREYWVDVTADELGRGVTLYTESASALVRLNPAPVGPNRLEKTAINPLVLTLVDPKGQTWIEGGGMEKLASADQLAEAGLPFPAGTSAFRVRSELGAGAFQVRAEGLQGKQRYVMHVMDAKSQVELTLRTSRANYLHGQTLEVFASLARGDQRFNLRKIDGFVSSPAGRAWPVEFERVSQGLYRASLQLDGLETPAPGLWEVHASAQGRVTGQPVLRATRAAFATAVPSATFNGSVELTQDAGWTVNLGVDVAAAGRYDVRGVLYATALDGTLLPAALAQTAAWLTPGSRTLALELSPESLGTQGLGAPFEMRDLRLSDQGRMGILHQQNRAFRVE